jgi:hypothetical protein
MRCTRALGDRLPHLEKPHAEFAKGRRRMILAGFPTAVAGSGMCLYHDEAGSHDRIAGSAAPGP